MSPSAFFLGCLAAQPALAVAFPGEVLPAGARAAGALLVVVGVALHRAGVRRFREAGTTVEPGGRPEVLVEDGPFAWTRNPMYLAGVPILLGVAALIGVPAALLPLPAYVIGAERWILPAEERALEARFGEAYARYRARVRRWM